MPKITISLTDDEAEQLDSYAKFGERIAVSRVIGNWIYRYAWLDVGKDRVQQLINVDPDVLRAVDKITANYNRTHGLDNYRIGRYPAHNPDARKADDTYNALLRRAIEDMIAKGDREP